MERRVSLITLASDDLDRAQAFYAALGWAPTFSNERILVFDLLGQSLGFYLRSDLAEDMGLAPEDLGTGATTLAHNVETADAVQPLLDRARSAGAKILRKAHQAHWGGTIGFFADLDGHIWEIAHNPFAPLGPDGAFRWDGYGDTQ